MAPNETVAKYKIGDEMHLVRNTKWKKSSDTVRTPYPDDIVVRFGLPQDVADQIMLDNSIPNTVDLDALQPAMEAGTAKARSKNMLCMSSLIPQPHIETKPFFMQ